MGELENMAPVDSVENAGGGADPPASRFARKGETGPSNEVDEPVATDADEDDVMEVDEEAAAEDMFVDRVSSDTM